MVSGFGEMKVWFFFVIEALCCCWINGSWFSDFWLNRRARSYRFGISESGKEKQERRAAIGVFGWAREQVRGNLTQPLTGSSLWSFEERATTLWEGNQAVARKLLPFLWFGQNKDTLEREVSLHATRCLFAMVEPWYHVTMAAENRGEKKNFPAWRRSKGKSGSDFHSRQK